LQKRVSKELPTRIKELLLTKQQMTLPTRISPLSYLLFSFLEIIWVGPLAKPVTESMRMLEQDTALWAGLGFVLDTYGMDLSKYVFNDTVLCHSN
jgi:hypothetical protein